MRDTKAFRWEIGFEEVKLSQLETNDSYIEAARPCGEHRFKYPPQLFRCCVRPTPVAILKQRPNKAKAIAVLVILSDRTTWYRKGGINMPTREQFAKHGITIETHIRRRSDYKLAA